MTGAERQRRRRALRRDGRVVLYVEARLHPLAEAVIRSERLSEAAALDQRQLAKVVADVVDEWVRRWCEK